MNKSFWQGYFFGALAMLLGFIFGDAFFTGVAQVVLWVAAQ